jgi:hypothetical protein
MAACLLGCAMVLGLPMGPAPEAQPLKADDGSVRVVEWKDLVPAGYDPDQLLKKYYEDVAPLRDNDPRAQQLASKLRQAWENAPVVEALNNKIVKLSGFLVTLEGDGKAVSAQAARNDLASASYVLDAMHVEPQKAR